MSAFDVIFLSYDEPAADRHWLQVRSRNAVDGLVSGFGGVEPIGRALPRCLAAVT